MDSIEKMNGGRGRRSRVIGRRQGASGAAVASLKGLWLTSVSFPGTSVPGCQVPPLRGWNIRRDSVEEPGRGIRQGNFVALHDWTAEDGCPHMGLADDRGLMASPLYFETAANWRTVLMNVFVARVRVRSRR